MDGQMGPRTHTHLHLEATSPFISAHYHVVTQHPMQTDTHTYDTTFAYLNICLSGLLLYSLAQEQIINILFVNFHICRGL